MRVGFLIPTDLEAQNIPHDVFHVMAAGYGAGKAAACSAAADLIFNKHCDTIIIWGLAGGLSSHVSVGDIVVGSRVAYRDYDISPLMDSTGIGWVKDFSENIFVELNGELKNRLVNSLSFLYPECKVTEGTVCSGDQFVHYTPTTVLNRVEKQSDVVDMESAAVVHFCSNINKNIKVGIVRIVSDHADGEAHIDFNNFLKKFEAINSKLNIVKNQIEWEDLSCISKVIKNYSDFPINGVAFKDLWPIFEDAKLLNYVCNLLYDRIKKQSPTQRIDKIAGVESRGFILGYELSKMLNVPFIPIRKKGKLPGAVVSARCKTEYSTVELEAKKSSIAKDDNVIVVDDIIATGGTLQACKSIIEQCGGHCIYCAAIGQINELDGSVKANSGGVPVGYLLRL